MTKYLFAAIAMTAIALTSCKKSNSQNSSKTPRTDVPSDLRGGWIWASGGTIGVFDPNTGVYQGPALGMAQKYSMNANGTGSLYNYLGSQTDKYQIYKEGTFEVDVIKGLVTFNASSGFYERNGSRRNLKAEELYPNEGGIEKFYYKIVNNDGKIYLYKKDSPEASDEDIMHSTRFSKL